MDYQAFRYTGSMEKLKGFLDITAHPERAWKERLDVPAFVVGAGAASAWLTLFHTRIEPIGAADPSVSEIALDLVLVAACLVFAMLTRKAAPLALRRPVVGASCVAVAAGTLLSAWGAGNGTAFLAGGALATVGTAAMLLLWREYFSCLSPVRIALYTACSALAGELIRAVLLCLDPAFLPMGMAALPCLSTAALLCAFRSLPAQDLPRAPRSVAPAPKMLLAVIAAYAFCYGLVDKTSESSVVITSLSKLLPALIVVVVVLLQSERFGFSDVYRLGAPLAICGGALFCGFPGMDPTIANLFVTFGFFVCRILANVEMGSLARTAGTSATYLFGVQIAMRYLASLAGKSLQLPQVEALMPDGFYGVLALAACLIAAGVALAFMRSGRRGAPFWGLNVREGGPADERAAAIMRIQRAAERFGLSERESEVLRLLIEDKTLAQIGRDLCIAEGTVKSHANRIYRKARVSGRRELAEALGEGREERPGENR